MHVVATAGHVDHGKSTLVQALTGQHPDRLEDERRRGLSIELGYCWTDLDGVGEVAFVDVPGHQRFIATTLAGLGPVPVTMFVVAADDPWMPQAAEHLAALDALGVEHALLVVTRSDLTDPAPALARAREELGRTSLAGSPAVTVSGRTGAGLDDLRARLTEVLHAVPALDPAQDVRLWVDRRFHVRGAGTVVTGTLPAGTIAVGDVLESAGGPVRVRGIESLEVPRDRVTGPARVALDLGGRAPEGVERGSTLRTPDRFELSRTVDVRLRGEDSPPREPLLHLGSTSTSVRLRPLGDGHARLELTEPLPLRVGDRALLRDPGSRTVWGVVVVDPVPPPLGRRGAAVARGRALEEHDGSLGAELAARGVVRRSLLRRIGVAGPLPGGALVVGDWLVAPDRAVALRAELVALVAAVPAAGPPLSRAAAARALGLPDDGLVAALVQPPLREEGGAVLGAHPEQQLPAALAGALTQVQDALQADPFAAPDRTRLRELGLDPAALAVLARAGRVLRLPEDVVLLPGADDLAVERLTGLPQPFTTSAARQALGTSRRVALPLLAHLDRTRRTVRLADDTRRLVRPPLPSPSSVAQSQEARS